MHKFLAIATLITAFSAPARAEVSEVVTGYQNGLTYLPLMVMQEKKLVEKHAAAAGLKDLKAEWRVFSGPAPINDGFLSGGVHFGAVGTPSVVTLWAKTKSSLGVRMVGSLSCMPMLLSTNKPEIKTIKDFTDKDRIATPSVKVGVQSVTLQMAAAQAFGDKDFDKLDKLTVGMGHPEAFTALMSGKSEIVAHFGGPPFQELELEQGGGKVHTVLKSYDVLGGKATFVAVVATDKFRLANPRVYAAYVAAFAEASDFINKDRAGAAEIYLKISQQKIDTKLLAKILADPDYVYDLTPSNVLKYADFMYKVGTIKEKAASWKDLAHPNLHDRSGS